MTTNYNFKKLCLTLRQDDDFLEQMKEKFYQMKINEAKEYKKQNQKGNYMDLLPDDVQEHIMNFKYTADKEYINHLFVSRKITNKFLEDWIYSLFVKYREKKVNSQKMSTPAPKYNAETLVFAIINRKHLWKEVYGIDHIKKYYSKRMKNSIKREQNVWNMVTKNDTPTLKSLTDHHDNYVKEQKEQKAKKKAEEEQKEDRHKPGDIVFYKSSYGNSRKTTTGFYVINSATKTQYRVSKITHSYNMIHCQYTFDSDYIYTIPRDKSQWEFYEDKSPNIGKKAYLRPVKNLDDDHKYIRYEEDKTKWVHHRISYCN